ncbi:protein of unknown function [Azospirillum baldaniorum]|uniref:Uncharacterized protein n=1 Tax=Azospirillum baldaniorum TaxID=1064539 RepID=A0A9P1JPY3_9PROT|nr:protein of unknown function [Azospirillum baldaniorum]
MLIPVTPDRRLRGRRSFPFREAVRAWEEGVIRGIRRAGPVAGCSRWPRPRQSSPPLCCPVPPT